jgi:cytochrome c oxidase subunit 2
MHFPVVVLPPEEFARWLAHQARPAAASPDPRFAQGAELFLMNGCGACHTVRGTVADGVVGPDLTHVGSRLTLGAGMLSNDADAFVRWMAQTEHLKPNVLMPEFGMLLPDDLRALAAYLEGLQ